MKISSFVFMLISPIRHRYSGSGNEYYCKTVSDRLPLTAVRKTGNTPLLFSAERHPRVFRRISYGSSCTPQNPAEQRRYSVLLLCSSSIQAFPLPPYNFHMQLTPEPIQADLRQVVGRAALIPVDAEQLLRQFI